MAIVRHPAVALDVGAPPCRRSTAGGVEHRRRAHRQLERPFFGVTTDGKLLTGLRSIDDAPRVTTQPITDAALAFLQALTPEQRQRVMFPIDADGVADVDQRPHEPLPPRRADRGSRPTGARPGARDLACDFVGAAASTRRGSIMRINELLAELTGDYDAFGEWPYFISIFGEPGGDAPWGWQFDGHHVCLNTMVFDGRMVMTPAFMGCRAAAHPQWSPRRYVVVRPGGVDRARADPRPRHRAAAAGDHLSVDPHRRHLAAAAEPVRRPDAGRRACTTTSSPRTRASPGGR